MYLFDRVTRSSAWESGYADSFEESCQTFYGTVVFVASDERSVKVAWDHNPLVIHQHRVEELRVVGRNPLEFMDALTAFNVGHTPIPVDIVESTDAEGETMRSVFVPPVYGMRVVRGPHWGPTFKGDLGEDGNPLPGYVISVLSHGTKVRVRWANEKAAIYSYTPDRMEIMAQV